MTNSGGCSARVLCVGAIVQAISFLLDSFTVKWYLVRHYDTE